MIRRRYKNTLENRVSRLEKLVYEKSVGRGGEPSNAMKVWQLLMDNGPMTRQQIQSSGLSATATAGASLNFYVAHDLLAKDGNTFVANPDYAWDDVGVIPRTAQQEIMNSVRDSGVDVDELSHDEVPIEPVRRGRASRARSVKANLFSRKYDEVKAAIDEGQDCKAANDKGVTPLVYACRDPKHQSSDIIKLLLDNGANPNDLDGKRPVIFTVIKNGDFKSAKELAIHGANLDGDAIYNNVRPVTAYILNGGALDDTLLALIKPKALEGERFWGQFLDDMSYRYVEGKISDSLYQAIVDKMFDGVSADKLQRNVSNGLITHELSRDIMVVTKKFTDMGELPPMDHYTVVYSGRYNKKLLNNIYDLLVRAGNGELKVRSAIDYINWCDVIGEALDKPIDFAFNFVTDDLIKQASILSLVAIIKSCIRTNNVSTLNKIARQKRDLMREASDIVHILANNNIPMKTTAAVCRILDSSMSPGENDISIMTLSAIRRSNNAYLVEYLFDRGFADEILHGITDINSTGISPLIKSLIKEQGIRLKSRDR